MMVIVLIVRFGCCFGLWDLRKFVFSVVSCVMISFYCCFVILGISVCWIVLEVEGLNG